MTSSRLDRLVAYGDSQTAGFSWGPKMVALSDTLTEAIGRGVSGQEAGSVAIRQGGIVLTTTADCTIPESTDSVLVQVQASVTPCNIRTESSDMPMILAGVRGIATALYKDDVPVGMPAPNLATGVFTVKFVPEVAPAEEVAVPSGTAFVSQDVADHPEYAESLTVMWVGTNDYAFAWPTHATGAVAAMKAMVAKLAESVDNPRFLVLSPTWWAEETSDTAGSRLLAIEVRDALEEAFPDNFVDQHRHIIQNGMDILGIDPTTADLASKAGDAIPRSLTSDGLHYSDDTREKVLAPFIVSELAARGWTTESVEEEPPVAFTPRSDWKAGDDYTAERIIELESTVAANASAAATATTANETANSAAQGVADLREDIASKADASALAKKLDAMPETQKSKIYGTGNDGQFYNYPYAQEDATPGSVVGRTGEGGVLVSVTPTVDGHATAKKYVDDLIAAQAALITALTDRVTALEAK